MLYKIAALAALVGGADALTIGAAPGSAVRTSSLVMAEDYTKFERAPGVGDPFVDGIRSNEGAFQPRGISDATVPKKQYIETSDEPWHDSCIATTSISKGALASALSAGLPFAAAEEALEDALQTVKDAGAVDAAIKTCIAAGGRTGSPAVMMADKLKKDFAKSKDGKVTRPKVKVVGGAKAGWADQGAGRKVATVHDNSVA